MLALYAPYIEVYAPADVPPVLYYSHNRRIPPIVGVMQFNWVMTTRSWTHSSSGSHGWPPSNSDMWAIFLANGPSFKAGVRPTPTQFQNVEVYNLLLSLLSIESFAASNNGTVGALDDYLVAPPARKNASVL